MVLTSAGMTGFGPLTVYCGAVLELAGDDAACCCRWWPCPPCAAVHVVHVLRVGEATWTRCGGGGRGRTARPGRPRSAAPRPTASSARPRRPGLPRVPGGRGEVPVRLLRTHRTMLCAARSAGGHRAPRPARSGRSPRRPLGGRRGGGVSWRPMAQPGDDRAAGRPLPDGRRRARLEPVRPRRRRRPPPVDAGPTGRPAGSSHDGALGFAIGRGGRPDLLVLVAAALAGQGSQLATIATAGRRRPSGTWGRRCVGPVGGVLRRRRGWPAGPGHRAPGRPTSACASARSTWPGS